MGDEARAADFWSLPTEVFMGKGDTDARAGQGAHGSYCYAYPSPATGT